MNCLSNSISGMTFVLSWKRAFMETPLACGAAGYAVRAGLLPQHPTALRMVSTAVVQRPHKPRSDHSCQLADLAVGWRYWCGMGAAGLPELGDSDWQIGDLQQQLVQESGERLMQSLPSAIFPCQSLLGPPCVVTQLSTTAVVQRFCLQTKFKAKGDVANAVLSLPQLLQNNSNSSRSHTQMR